MMMLTRWWTCYCFFLILLYCQTSISNEAIWPEDCWTEIVSPSSKLVRRNMSFQIAIKCNIEVNIPQRKELIRSFTENKVQFCVVRDHDQIFLPCFPRSHLSYVPTTDWILSLLPLSNQSHCLSSNTLKFDEVCTNESVFSIRGFKSVTLPYITYVKEIHDNHVIRHNFAWAMFDLDTDRYLPTYKHSLAQLQQRDISGLNQTAFDNDHNMLYIFHWQQFLQRVFYIPRTLSSTSSTLTTSEVEPLPTTSTTSISAGEGKRFRIMFFFKEVRRHGANNRMLQWIALLDAARYEIHILSGDHHGDEALSQQLIDSYQVTMHITKVLQFDFIQQHIAKQSPNMTDFELSSTWQFESSNVIRLLQQMDYLVLTNCVGSLPTVILFQGMLARASPSPIIIIDASNPGVPASLLPLIDVIVAPSKASALQSSAPYWNHSGIPLAIIYPVLSSFWLQYGYCFLSKEQQEQKLLQLRPSLTASEESKFRFIYVGRLASEKNPGLILRALNVLVNYEKQLQYANDRVVLDAKYTSDVRLLEEVRRRIEVVLVGDGPLMHMFMLWIEMHQLSPYVKLLGSLDEVKVNDEMMKADALLNPGIYGETFGYVHLEAFANGLPVIAFNRGAVPESLMYGVLLDMDYESYHESYPIQVLAQTMMDMVLFRDVNLLPRDEICKLAVDILPSRFSLDNYVNNFEDVLHLYDSVLKGNKSI